MAHSPRPPNGTIRGAIGPRPRMRKVPASQLGKRATLATLHTMEPAVAFCAATPVAPGPDKVTDCPAASELLTMLISPIRTPLEPSTPTVTMYDWRGRYCW